LRVLGFDGPFSGTRHQFLVKEENRLAIPSNEEFSVPQLRMMLREAASILGREISLRNGRDCEHWWGGMVAETRGACDFIA
jgi:hypothetical protein